MIQDLVPRVREALKVSSSYDGETLPNIIKRSCRFILRGWDFPKANARWDSPTIALGADMVALPTGFEKPWAVKLLVNENNTILQKDLPRGGFQALPHAAGPQSYSIIGTNLYLDTAMPEAAYWLRVWYKSVDVALHEAWLTSDYEDTVFTRAVFAGANEMSKPEVLQAYAPLWQEQVEQLGITISENNYADTEVVMRPDTRYGVPRYGGLDAIG